MDKNKLLRDYEKFPLKYREMPERADLIYLTLECLWSDTKIAEYLNKSKDSIIKWRKKFGIKKTQEQINASRKATCIERFGTDHHWKNAEVQEKRKQTFLEKYGVENPFAAKEIKEKIKQQNLELYGVENAHQRQDVITKAIQTNSIRYDGHAPACSEEIQEKIKETNIQRYGTVAPMNSLEIQNKTKETNIQKYGTIYPQQSPQIKEKTKQTCLRKYGKEFAFQATIVKEKTIKTSLESYKTKYPNQCELVKNHIKQSNFKKYGVEHPMQLPEVREKYKKTMQQRYNAESPAQFNIKKSTLELLADAEKLKNFISNKHFTSNELAKILGVSISHINKTINAFGLQSYLDRYTSRFEQELGELLPLTFSKNKTAIAPLEIDLYNDNLKLGIEFNGDYWHQDTKKGILYHQQKSLNAEKRGIFIYHIFEYEWLSKREKIISQITNLLKNNSTKFFARNCIIKEVSFKESHTFLNTNHLQGGDKSKVRLGLYQNDTLIALMTFCKPRFNKKIEWELSRFCTLGNTTVVGGCSKLFKYFIKNYKPSSIISYSDIGKTRGDVYKILNFTLHHISAPNYVWTNGYQTLSRYQCQKHKLKKFQHLGETENDIMRARGFLKIYDCGNKVWVWQN